MVEDIEAPYAARDFGKRAAKMSRVAVRVGYCLSGNGLFLWRSMCSIAATRRTGPSGRVSDVVDPFRAMFQAGATGPSITDIFPLIERVVPLHA
jgi:hypothetical protein